MKIKDELFKITKCLDDAGVDYGLCGGLAVAIHGYPRFTKDIDILIRTESLEVAKSSLANIDYDLEGGMFRFNPGSVDENCMYRVSRAEGHELLTLDLMLVAPAFEEIWAKRVLIQFDEQLLKVVSKSGLITMKRLAGRPQDLADIDALKKVGDE